MVSGTDMHARASLRRSFSPAGRWRPSLMLKSALLSTLLFIPLVVPTASYVAVAGYAAAHRRSRRRVHAGSCRVDAGCCQVGAHAGRAKAATTLCAARTHESSDGETRKGRTTGAVVAAAAAEEDDGPPLPPLAPTTKRLFLVRHGEVINPGGPDRPVYYGGADVPLSPLGEAEARAAASYLRRFDLHRVASSPLSRAAFGAREVLMLQRRAEKDDRRQRRRPSESRSTETLHELLTFDGFRELDRGDWCGLTAEEIGLDNLARFDACDETVTPGGGGESYTQLKSRVLQARNELLDLTDGGKCSALVSHLQVTRSLLSDALGMPTHEMAGLKVATASITCIDYCSVTGEQTVHFQSFKPDVGLAASRDMAN